MVLIHDENSEYQTKMKTEKVIRQDPKRWIVLGAFSLATLLNSFHWIQYNIVQDLVIFYYNQSLPASEAQKIDAVNWLSMVYMLCYIPLVFPAMFLLERKGLRLSVLVGSLLTFIGASVKCAAVRQDLFGVAMFAQTICAIAQAFTLSVPARLSALWFGQNEIGLATSIGVFGNQLGTAIGFVIPPLLLVKSDPINIIERNFYYLLIISAVTCGIVFVLCFIFVKDEPKDAPSLAQWEVRNIVNAKEKKQDDFKIFKKSLKSLFKNYNFCLLLISYGINTGAYYSIGTLLNLIISYYYENENENIGIIGLILILAGLIGSIICGLVLDKTKKFKKITFSVYLGSLLAMILFTFTLKINIWIIFGTTFLLGFFMTGYLPVGFELAAEVTYPISEGTSCGLLNTSAQIFGIIFTYSQGRIIYKHGSLAGNIYLICALVVGTILTGFVRSDFRRQNAIKLEQEISKTMTENTSSFSTVNTNIDELKF